MAAMSARLKIRHDARAASRISVGVGAAGAGRLPGVIAARAGTGQTRAAWQRAALAAAGPGRSGEQALAMMPDV